MKVSEVQVKEAEVADKEESWGRRACEGLAQLSGSIEGLTAMIGRQNLLLGRLVGMLEEEADWARWRRKRQGEPVVPPAVILGKGDEEEEEIEEEAGNKGENEEDGE